MKKLLATLCAAALLLSLSAPALASAGVSVKPRGNEWNSVAWEDGSGTLARVTFKADSDPDSFYSKLSTDWSDCPYEELFSDQDAYLFDFVGSPLLPATSLPTLAIYSPYVDEDGEPISGKSISVYRADGGKLRDVTKSFTAGYDGEERPVLLTATRQLGAYILAEKKIDLEAAAGIDATAPEQKAAGEKAAGEKAAGDKAPAAEKKVIRLPAYDRTER